MEVFLIVVQSILAILIVLVVLLQKGKGADMGVTFGGGVTSSIWGPKGPTTFLAKLTVILMVLFFLNSLTLTIMMGKPRFSKAVEEASKVVPPSEGVPGGITNGTR